MADIHRGSVVLLKRPLADLICVVSSSTETGVRVRYIDSPEEDEGVDVRREDVIRLAKEQSEELPPDFLTAIERQRLVIFTPKPKKKESVGKVLGGVSDEVYGQIFEILANDGKEEE